jgi:ABC-2 type transport system ATP-binding protein
MFEPGGLTRRDGQTPAVDTLSFEVRPGRVTGSDHSVLVRTPQVGRLRHALELSGAVVEVRDDGSMSVSGLGAEDIGDIAGAYKITVHELSPQASSLEDAPRLTGDCLVPMVDLSPTDRAHRPPGPRAGDRR